MHGAVCGGKDMAIKRLISDNAKAVLAAKKEIKNFPVWATLDAKKAEKYIDKNVKDLEGAKEVLKAMAKMIIHLRDINVP